jgi:hypothetical protein
MPKHFSKKTPRNRFLPQSQDAVEGAELRLNIVDSPIQVDYRHFLESI